MPGIAGFAAAAEATAATLADDLAHQLALRLQLEDGLAALRADIHLAGAAAERLPNTTCVRFGLLDAEQVLNKLERAGIVASSGAACTASGTQPSHVLLAMGQTPLAARASVRFSLGRHTTSAEITALLAAVREAILPLLQASAEAVPA
jgi:cysteine desulfurase